MAVVVIVEMLHAILVVVILLVQVIVVVVCYISLGGFRSSSCGSSDSSKILRFTEVRQATS